MTLQSGRQLGSYEILGPPRGRGDGGGLSREGPPPRSRDRDQGAVRGGSVVPRPKEALERDPGYALAWTELSRAYSRGADLGWAPIAEAYGLAREAVERALALDPELADGHALMARIRMADWDWRGAQVSCARALELAPEDARVLRIAAWQMNTMGCIEEAIGLFRRALDRDPLSAATYHTIGGDFDAAARLAEAEAAYRKALELAPQGAGMRASLSLTLLAQNRGEEALSEALREPEEAFRLFALAIVHHGLGHQAESDAALRELNEKHAEGAAFQIADVYGARGEADAAFEWLERAYAQRDGGVTDLRINPRLRCLHGDPRWGRFLKKMGMED